MARELTQEILFSQARACVPKLKESLSKGQLGRLAVLGGSYEYSGAPYFAASAAYRLGCDLVYVYCCKDAGNPIKSYSSEMIVLPMLRTSAEAEHDYHLPHDESLSIDRYNHIKKDVISSLNRWIKPLQALVVGPGLGRDGLVIECAKAAISAAKDRDIPIVLDGDALWALCSDLEMIKGYDKAILTPNIAEFKRLCKAIQSSIGLDYSPRDESHDAPPLQKNYSSSADLSFAAENTNNNNPGTLDNSGQIVIPGQQSLATSSASSVEPPSSDAVEIREEDMANDPILVQKVALALGGVTVVRKGTVDVISDGEKIVECSRPGGLRRCGGQGDILAGAIGTFAGWNFGPQSTYRSAEKLRRKDGHKFTASKTMLAAWGGCAVTREASHRTYELHHRGTTTTLILDQVAPSFHDLFEHSHTGLSISSNAHYLKDL